MKRKEIAIGLIFCLLIGFLPTNAWADGEGSLDLQNGSITITESGYTQEEHLGQSAQTAIRLHKVVKTARQIPSP